MSKQKLPEVLHQVPQTVISYRLVRTEAPYHLIENAFPLDNYDVQQIDKTGPFDFLAPAKKKWVIKTLIAHSNDAVDLMSLQHYWEGAKGVVPPDTIYKCASRAEFTFDLGTIQVRPVDNTIILHDIVLWDQKQNGLYFFVTAGKHVTGYVLYKELEYP